MASKQAQDSASYLKLVKLHAVMQSRMNSVKNVNIVNEVKNILEQEGDINYKLPKAGLIKGSDLAGCSIMHLMSREWNFKPEHIQFFDLLLDHGADITNKNSKGRTVIHDVLTRNIPTDNEIRSNPPLQCVDRVLSAHLKFRIIANPVDSRGISHFHAACMMNDVKIIEFFLDNGVSIDQRVNADSPIFAGYTPLHFAIEYVCLEAVKLLLQRGAKIDVEDASRMTPLHLIVDSGVRVSKILKYDRNARKNLEKCLEIIEQILASDVENGKAKDHFGLSRLHVLCTLKDSSRLDRHLNEIENVNCIVNTDSPICPGFTPLHFAALFNLDSLKLLVTKGGDITIKDAEEETALDLCIARYGTKDIHDILPRSIVKDTTFSNRKAKLTNLVHSIRSFSWNSSFETFLRKLADANAHILASTPLWPAYTPLHLLIHIQKKCSYGEGLYDVIGKCLRNGADVSAKGVLDQTPLQFAFTAFQHNDRGAEVVDQMLKHHQGTSNPVDADGLNHLHIACAAKDKRVVEILLDHGADVNCKLRSSFKWHSKLLWNGSTPLHVAVAIGDSGMVKLLLERGADLQARDDNGMTAVHRLMTSHNPLTVASYLLSSSRLRECVADSCGLSHLHVACHFDCSGAVKKLLLEPEVQVNAAIDCKTSGESSFNSQSELVRCDGFTPLYMAMDRYGYRYSGYEVMELLLLHGADVLAGSAENKVPLYKVMCKYCGEWRHFAALIKSDEILRRRIFERISGLTELHLACFERDLSWINELLTDGADVNARMCDDSPIWSGWTPLHVLMTTGVAKEPDAVLQLLLDKGANVAVSDTQNMTPLHMSGKFYEQSRSGFNGRPSEYCLDLLYENETLSESPCDPTSLMIRSIKDFSSNPTNDHGISHFHIACDCLDVVAVEEFLRHGVDVNASINYFSPFYGGYTPLHVALTRRGTSPRRKKVVQLLLKHGADIHAENWLGNTALHCVAKYAIRECIPIFTMLFKAGANINAKNISGASPFEILLTEGHVKKRNMYYFIRHGCRINDFNCCTDEGLIPLIIASAGNHKGEENKKLLLSSPNIGKADEMDRSAIHNIVSTYSPRTSEQVCIYLIEEVEKLGIDVDHQDKSGQTALHVAARFQNDCAISALLAVGADINITDAAGKTAFGYSLIPRKEYNYDLQRFVEIFNENAIGLFITHAHKLGLTELHVSELNEDCKRIALERYCNNSMMDKHQFRAILDSVDDAKVGCQSLSLRDFVSANGPVWKYSKLRRMNREQVVELFDTILDKRYEEKLGELRCLVKLQYRNYLTRSELIEDAKMALSVLANIPVPDLCSEAIFARFENWELRNVIEAAN